MKSLLGSLGFALLLTPVLMALLAMKGHADFSLEMFAAIYLMTALATWLLVRRDMKAERQVREGRELQSINIMTNDPLIDVIASIKSLSYRELFWSGTSQVVSVKWALHARNSLVNSGLYYVTLDRPLLPDDLKKELKRIAIKTGPASFLQPQVIGVILENDVSTFDSQALVDIAFAGRAGIAWVIQVKPRSRIVDACKLAYPLSTDRVFESINRHFADSGFEVRTSDKVSPILNKRSSVSILFGLLSFLRRPSQDGSPSDEPRQDSKDAEKDNQ